MRILTFAFLFLGLIPLAAPAQGKVWVVDEAGGPGFHFKTVVEAVGAARDGDTLLIRQGRYFNQANLIVNKSLTLVRDTASGDVTLPGLTVSKIGAGQSFHLRGLTLAGSLVITDSSGSILVDSCTFDPVFQFGGISTQNCRAVTISHCDVKAKTQSAALSIDGSGVHAFDSKFRGGPVGHGANMWGVSARLFASSCEIVGGSGIIGQLLNGRCYRQPLTGGDGLRVAYGRAELRGCTVRGGLAAPANGACAAGVPGRDIVRFGGTVNSVAQATRQFVTNSPVREGQFLEFRVDGQPGDQAFLVFNLESEPLLFPGCQGALFPTLGGLGSIYMGQVQNGPVRLRVQVQPMGPTDDFVAIATQVLLLPRTGCILSPPAIVVLLDQRF